MNTTTNTPISNRNVSPAAGGDRNDETSTELVNETRATTSEERAIVKAARAIVAETVRGFDRMIVKAQALASADADASDVKSTRKADLAKSAGMSPGQYSKLCKVGRATSAERDAYMALAGDLASVKGFYTYLTPAKSKPEAETESADETESDETESDASPAVALIDVMLGNLANLSREELSTLGDAIAARLAVPTVRSAA